MSGMTLAERYPGVPVFRFGSAELEKFHGDKWTDYVAPVWRTSVNYYSSYRYTEPGRIRVANSYEQYIVDHGGFFTLNTFIAGQCAVRMEEIPGPWGAAATPSSDPYNIRYVYDANGNTVAHVRSGFSRWNPSPFDQDTALANAALIAAAPELLSELERLVEHTLHYATMPHAHSDAARDAANARAIIAEARGEK